LQERNTLVAAALFFSMWKQNMSLSPQYREGKTNKLLHHWSSRNTNFLPVPAPTNASEEALLAFSFIQAPSATHHT